MAVVEENFEAQKFSESTKCDWIYKNETENTIVRRLDGSIK